MHIHLQTILVRKAEKNRHLDKIVFNGKRLQFLWQITFDMVTLIHLNPRRRLFKVRLA